ncbi:MAG: hypothetical protein ACYTFG_16750 [Planctomycetota bacterium]|jgi:hypothetical protein
MGIPGKAVNLALVFAIAAAMHAGPAQAGEERSEPYPLKVFDVAALVKPLKDFPGPRFELSAGKALESMMRDLPGSLPGDLEPHRPAVLTVVDLEDLIRQSDPLWENPPEGARLNLVRNRLFVQGPPDAVSRLETLLRALEREASRSYLVRAVLFDLPAGTGEKLLGKPGTLLSEDAASKRMASIPSSGGKMLADASMTAMNGQLAHIVDGRERTFLVDYEVLLAKGAAEADPIVEIFRDGIILEARPISSPTGSRVRLELYVGYSRFEPHTEKFDPGNPKLGPIDLPRVTGFRMETSLTLPDAHFLVLGPLMPRSSVAPPEGGGSREEGKEDVRPKGEVYMLLQAKALKQ